MTVLTRTLRHLTVGECMAVAGFKGLLKRAEHWDKFGKESTLPVDGMPEIIQEWYSEWLRDDHYPLSPVDKDHADDLWQKFCEEVGR